MIKPSHPALLILGGGYVGKAVAEVCPGSYLTHRTEFELGRESSWKNIDTPLAKMDHVLWTFPAATTEEESLKASQFYKEFLIHKKVVIYGTTSSYVVRQLNEWVNEETPVHADHPRAKTEKTLQSQGACILRLAGIFGPGRDPISWYQRGLIKTGRNYLNLIHLRDIVSVTTRLLDEPKASGKVFNLSNGKPKTHFEIIELLKKMNHLPTEFRLPDIEKSDSKRVSNEKIRKFLSLQESDFIEFPEES